MELRVAMRHVWVRAIVLSVAFLTLFTGLFILGATQIEGGSPAIGGPVLKVDLFVLFIAVFLGPAWVIAPNNRPPGGGPPRGGIVPIPLKTPEQVNDSGQDEAPPAAA
jgi:hypothetical protein